MPVQPKTKGELGIATARTIQSDPLPRPVPEVDFSWGPLSVPWAELGETYPYDANEPVTGAPAQEDVYLTPGTAEITFTAAVRVPEGDFIISHEWDFGDGFTGFGASVTHSYTAPSAATRAVLCVTDNHGRRFCRGQQVNLRPADLTVVSQGIIG